MAEKQINNQGILEFLQRLGRCYRHTGIVYLVGGSSLILVAAKESTFDIDLKFEVPPEHHTEFIRCLRQLSREMKLPVEQAAPDEFLPLPTGYENRRSYIGRFGSLEVYHFDFYSMALSKLFRGNEKDFADVIAMVRAGLIELEKLKGFFQEILPQLETFSLRADPQDFQRKFDLFLQRLSQ